tara:strand:+ start:8 stop:295 length:288 start_codon:yes stop_codon:yes gene_type:complete
VFNIPRLQRFFISVLKTGIRFWISGRYGLYLLISAKLQLTMSYGAPIAPTAKQHQRNTDLIWKLWTKLYGLIRSSIKKINLNIPRDWWYNKTVLI